MPRHPHTTMGRMRPGPPRPAWPLVLVSGLLLAIGIVGYFRAAHRTPILHPTDPSIALRIDPNTADVDHLRLLPGIGAALAPRIARERADGGPYTQPRDLLRVRGIGVKTAEKVSPHLTIGPPASQPAWAEDEAE